MEDEESRSMYFGIAPSSILATVSSAEIATLFSHCPLCGVGVGCAWAFLVPKALHRICVCGEMLENISMPGATSSIVRRVAAKSVLAQVPDDEKQQFLRKHLCVVDQRCHIHRGIS